MWQVQMLPPNLHPSCYSRVGLSCSPNDRERGVMIHPSHHMRIHCADKLRIIYATYAMNSACCWQKTCQRGDEPCSSLMSTALHPSLSPAKADLPSPPPALAPPLLTPAEPRCSGQKPCDLNPEQWWVAYLNSQIGKRLPVVWGACG